MRTIIGSVVIAVVLSIAVICQPCFAIDGARVFGEKEEMSIPARSADRVIQEAAMKQETISMKTDIEKRAGDQLGNTGSINLPREIVEKNPVNGMAPNPGYGRVEMDPNLIARILAAGNPKPTPQPPARTPKIIQGTKNTNPGRTNLPGIGFKPEKPYYGGVTLRGVVNITRRVIDDETAD